MSWSDSSLIIIILALQHVMIEGQNMEPSLSEHFHYFSCVFLCSAVSSATAGSSDLLAQSSLQEQHVLRQSLCLYSACLFGFVLINPVIGFQRQRREKNNLKTKLLKRIQCTHSREECDFGGLCSCFISLEDFNQPDYTRRQRDF